MPLQRNRDVFDELDRLAGSAMRKAGPEYVEGVARPIVDVVRSAGGFAEVLSSLGAALFHRMDSRPLEKNVADAMGQAGLIGRVAATPRRKA